jgi:hypothetical protein
MMKDLIFATLLISALCVTCAVDARAQGDPTKNYLTFSGSAQRTGWIANETILTPANVSGGQFGPIWNSPQFDSVSIGGTAYTPKMYATPLYVDSVTMSAGLYASQTFSAVIAATSNGYIYAVNAFPTAGSNAIPGGAILWKTKLTNPEQTSNQDGGIPLGVMGTPVIDVTTSPPRIYVASDDAAAGWEVFALDLTSGSVLPGWPLSINNTTLAPINQNGPATFQPSLDMSQRSALNLSPDGRLLYVPFAAYSDGGAGWMVAVDTVSPKLASAFAGAPSLLAAANGGMWASSGPAVDANGIVYATTGNGTAANEATPNYWSQSVLQWSTGSPLSLLGTYTPFNYCAMDLNDGDLAGGGPVVLPDLGSANTSTPHLLAFGGKQGNMYLLDRDHMPGSLTVHPGCSTNSATDPSLLPPGGQPQFSGAPGPINIFGPYSEDYINGDNAKSRSSPAYFTATDGTNYLFATGSTKQTYSSEGTVPPCVVRLKIVTSPGTPAYLALDQSQNSITMLSPGSPVVTSSGSTNAIVWVLVGNVPRAVNLLDPNVAHPILYALDQNLNILWNSTQTQLDAGGKYMIPAFARGTVFVGTDSIQAFGLVPQNTNSTEVAINAGGEAVGGFSADLDFSEGQANSFTNTVNLAGVQNPAPESVYQSYRSGSNQVGFNYTISNLTAGGSYLVRLHFAEPTANAIGARVFNVAINGTTVLPNFDIFETASGEFNAAVEQFPATANSSGNVVVAYTYGAAGDPLASGLEVIPVSSGPSATFLSSDTTTQGNWMSTYGSDGYDLAGGPQSPANGALSYGSYSVQNEGEWTWAPSTSDTRALKIPGGTGGIAASWYSAPAFSFAVNVGTGSHVIALYAMDWDARGRTETIQIVDAKNPANQLDSRTISNFTGGVYLVWNISGSVIVNVTANAGPNSVVSGVFFGSAPQTAPHITSASSASFSVGTAGSFTVTTTGNPAPALNSPSGMPTGVTFNPATGMLSGTPAAGMAGSYNFTFTASNGVTPSATQNFTLTVNPQATISSPTAGFIKADTAAQGNWIGVYGSDGYDLAASLQSPAGGQLPYGTYAVQNQLSWTWTATTSDVRALETNTQGARTAATWYSNGATFSFDVNLTGTHQVALYVLDWDNQGRNETVKIVDANNSANVLDTRTISGASTNTTSANFVNGTYLVWNISGHVTVTITSNSGPNSVVAGIFFGSTSQSAPTVTSANSTTFTAGAAGSFTVTASGYPAPALTESAQLPPGINFVDNMNGTATLSGTASSSSATSFTITANNGVPPNGTQNFTLTVNPQPTSLSSASWVKADTVTQGTWSGVYGSQGYSLATGSQNIQSISIPATFSLQGQLNWAWAASTTNTRALTIDSTGDRTAACWYSGGNFTLNLNFTDGQIHQVAIYVLDWDSQGRSETISVADAATNKVWDSRSIPNNTPSSATYTNTTGTNFVNGTYLVWNISGNVKITVTSAAGPNAVVSGIFFDP